jgi:hypothetical protein
MTDNYYADAHPPDEGREQADSTARLAQVQTLNDQIQSWANDHATEIPPALDQLLSELDLLLNGP